MSAIRVIQTALYALLSADSTVLALATGGVHNDVPDGQVYPHVLISRATEVEWNTMGGASAGIGWNALIDVHVYSRYQGDLEALQILDRVSDVLHYQAVTVTGYPTVICKLERTRAMVESIAKIETRHIVGEFRVKVHQ